jgi:2-keto-4-pentenoate hydratase
MCDIAGQEVTLSCNGVVRRRGTAAEALDHPLVPLTWLANELSRTGVGMTAGQVISTGTLTGMLRPHAGETYVADFGPFGTVTATYA